MWWCNAATFGFPFCLSRRHQCLLHPSVPARLL